MLFFFFSSRRRHTRCSRDWSSDVCSSDLRSHFADGRKAFSEGMASLLRVGVALFPGERGCCRSGQHTEPLRQLGRGALGAAADLSVPFLVSDSCRENRPRSSRRPRFGRDFSGPRSRLTVWFQLATRITAPVRALASEFLESAAIPEEDTTQGLFGFSMLVCTYQVQLMRTTHVPL